MGSSTGSLSSVKNKRKSSFSCGATCDYNFQQWPFFDLQLPTTIGTGDNQVSNITEYDSMTNGNPYTYPFSYAGVTVTQDSATIASTGPDSSTSTNIIEYGNALGTTNIYNIFIDDEYEATLDYCEMAQNETWQVGMTTVGTKMGLLGAECIPSSATFRLQGSWQALPFGPGQCVLSDYIDIPIPPSGGSCAHNCFVGNPDSTGKSVEYCTKETPRYSDGDCLKFTDTYPVAPIPHP
ncbi:hypothetical protein EDE15_4036 [Edaphobacter aggregans]|uniref:Uncharacterized protein n=1 Tax=Edaphobacter aggregans TaxID=570835 RepID=A0A3R9PC56_9BACT|nr:hypothetical protein [Edaphobacter aggregans]RSL18461.1 hypothetical protein EDE15_4036 [Edaphobacter aggregans]